MFNHKIERDGLSILCKDVRYLMENKEYDICQERITEAMKVYPHAPSPII